MTVQTHATAVVHPRARLDAGVVVGPYAVIDEEVEVGEGTVVGPHAVLHDGARVGRGCRVFAGAVVASVPQDVHFRGERSYAVIGDDVVLREHVTISRATGEGAATRVGPRAFVMIGAHVGHNGVVGEGAVLANNVSLGGHVEVGAGAFLGGHTGIHQYVHVGALVMTAGGTLLGQDCPPYVMIAGPRGRVYGVNAVGLERAGFQPEEIRAVQRALRILFRSGLNVGQALERIASEMPGSPAVAALLAFVRESRASERRRGLVRWAED